MTYKKQGVKDFNFPLIIKPINGAGSQNVFKVDNKKELNFFYRLHRKPNYSRIYKRNGIYHRCIM